MTSTRVGNLMITKYSSGVSFTSTSNSEHNSISLIPLNGLNCGVPTRTTPTITPVTPTTLCENLDQMFLKYQMETESHQNEAGFVPPLLQPISSVQCCSTSLVSSTSACDTNRNISNLPPLVPINELDSPSPPIPVHVLALTNENSCSSSSSSSTSSSGKKSCGGRRPNKNNSISPEEEERRNIRRERNKAAAARCRKRRADLTNQLTEETSSLEYKKRELEEEVEEVKLQIETLRRILKEHETTCTLRDTESPDDCKPLVIDIDDVDNNLINTDRSLSDNNSRSSNIRELSSHENKIAVKRRRPNFLPINSVTVKGTGIPIDTPSADIIDSLMPSGTGLTPITSAIVSSCSTQLRTSASIDLTSPDPSIKKLLTL